MSWTDERVNLLKQLWGEGKTAAEIAKVLGDGVTRNAVIGKAHRLKLSSRASPIQQNKKSVKTTTADRPRPLRKEPVVKNINFKGKEVSLAELGPRDCRWPNGDPSDKENFSFCGHKCAEGLPYCEEHAKIAYQIVSRSKVLNVDHISDQAGAPQDFDIKHAAEG